jgi:hypothetical protein
VKQGEKDVIQLPTPDYQSATPATVLPLETYTRAIYADKGKGVAAVAGFVFGTAYFPSVLQYEPLPETTTFRA